MAGKREELGIDLIASDKASKVLGDVADQVEKLDGKTAEVDITAEDRATAEVRTLMSRIEGLTDDEKQVILTAEGRKLEAEVKKATLLLGKVDGEEAEAVLEAKDLASKKLDAVQAELNTVDGRIADAALEATDNASDDINRVDGKLDELDRTTATATIDADAGAGLTDLFDNVGGLGGTLRSLASPTGAIVAVGGAFAAAALQAADVAIEADNTAQFTGSSVEEASKLHAVLRDKTNIEAADLLDIIAQMQGVLTDNPQLATDLGLSMDQVRTDPLAAFISAVDLLSSDQLTANERILIGAQLFGEEGVRQVNSIIGVLGPNGLRGEVDAIAGARIVSPEDVERAREFKEQWSEATAKAQELAMAVGGPLLDAALAAERGFSWLFGGFNDTENPSEHLDTFIERFERLKEVLADEGLDFDFLKTMNEADFPRLASELNITTEQFADFIGLLKEGKEPAEAFAEATGAEVPALEEATEATEDHTSALEDEIAVLEGRIETGEELIEQIEGEADAYYDARDAGRAFRKQVDETTAALEEHGEESDEGQQALDDLASAADDAASAEADLTGATQGSLRWIDAQNASLLAQAATLDGPMQRAILAHVLRINGIPEERITQILTDTDPNDLAQTERELDGPANKRRVAAVNVLVTQNTLDNANKRLNSIRDPEVRVRVRIPPLPRISYRDFGTYQSPVYTSGSGAQFLARGSMFTPEGTFLVGEDNQGQGGELVTLPAGSEVTPAGRTAEMLRNGGGGDTFQTTNIVNLPAGANPRDVMRALRRWERRNGS